MAFNLAYTEISGLFLDTAIFGLGWIVTAATAGISIWLISKDTSKMKILAFPVLTGWYIAGLKSGTIFDIIILISAAVMFTIEALSIETAGRVIDTVWRKAREGATRITEAERALSWNASVKAKEQYLEKKAATTAGIRRIQDLASDMAKASGRRGTELARQHARGMLEVNAQEELDKLEAERIKAERDAAKERRSKQTHAVRMKIASITALNQILASNLGQEAYRETLKRTGDKEEAFNAGWKAMKRKAKEITQEQQR